MINLKLFIISVLLMILASIGLLYSQSGEKEVIQREIDSLLKLSYSNENTDLEKARRYSQLSLSKAESIKDIKRLCDAYISYGYHSYLSKRTDKSLYYLEKAIGLAEKINYQVGLGHAYQRLGKIYSYDGQVEQSYESFNKALRIFEKLNKQIELAQIYNDLGSLFIYGLDDYYLSSKYFQKSKELSKEHKLFEEEIKSDLGNVDLFLKNKKTYRVDGILNDIFQKLKKVKSDLALGKYYKFYTKYYLDSKQYHKSIESAEKAIEHFEKVKNNRQLSVVYTYLDFAYLQIGDKKKALEYSQKALEIRDTLGDLTSKISSLINLAYDHHYLENNKNAIELANNALELLKQQDNKYYTKRAYHLLAEAFKAAGDLEKAYEYKNLELQNSYELDDERKRNSILMLEFSHKMKLKDAELKNLNEKTKNSTYITIFITSLALVVLIFLLIIYSGKRKNTNLLKNKNKIILDQNEELKQEVKNRDKILSIIVVEILNPIIQLRNVSKFIFEKKNYQNAQILEATLSTINNTSEALYQSAQNLIHWSKVKEEKNGFKPEK